MKLSIKTYGCNKKLLKINDENNQSLFSLQHDQIFKGPKTKERNSPHPAFC